MVILNELSDGLGTTDTIMVPLSMF